MSLFLSCQPTYNQGKLVYDYHCANCHGKNGEGLRKLYPPLKDADYLKENTLLLPCLIKYGMHDSIFVNKVLYYTEMPKNSELSDIDITNLTNYILSKWTDENSFISLQDVKNKIEQCN